MKTSPLSFFAAAIVLALSSHLFAADCGPSIPPDTALKKLLVGNGRFASGEAEHPRQGEARRKEVARGQKPFAIVVSCSDSRTPPEVIFDQGLGDVFVTRVAGNTVDNPALGSIEYALSHFPPTIIVVLGHQRCGAVEAAIAGGTFPGKIGAAVKPILPAVEAVRRRETPTVEAVVDENARRTAAALSKRSSIVESRLKAGTLKIVAARYELDSGRVKLLK